MKILVASPYLPWPLNAGGKVALYSSLACLRNDHRFTLVCPVYNHQGLKDADELQKELPEIRVRAVYCGSPQSANHHKDDILLRSLRWGARKYSRLSSNPPAASQQEARQLPAYPFGPLPAAYVDALDAELVQGVDLVQAEFAEMMSLGAWLPPGIPKVFIHHQLHFVYAKRFTAARKLSHYSKYLEKVMYVEEEAYLKKFDGVVVFSEEDKHALGEMLPKEKVYVSPFPIPTRSVPDGGGGFESYFTFVGSEEHFPNRDGLEWLTTEVWPEIRNRAPASRLKVIGPWDEAARSRLSSPGIEFMGYVDDLATATQGSILLVPVRIGSGIRVKLLDAMSQGVPAVSTSIGGEGIPATDGVDLLIRDDASGFASAAVQLMNSKELRARLASAGRDLVARLYSPDQVRKRRNEIYQDVCSCNSPCVP